MFGYLNLNDPTKIGDNESQEAVNVKIDSGFLEYKEYDIDESGGRVEKDLDGSTIYLNGTLDVTAAKSVISRTGAGYLFREYPGGKIDLVGVPSLIDTDTFPSGNPVLSVVSAPSSPVFGGQYQYAITIYDPDSGEESAGLVWTRTFASGEAISFTSFPQLTNGANNIYAPFSTYRTIVFKNKTNAEYRIYRRSPGSPEFYRVPFPTIGAFSGGTPALIDQFADGSLGAPCENVWFLPMGSNFPVVYPYSVAPLDKSGWSIFTIHNGRLWFKRDFPRSVNVSASSTWESLGGTSVLYYTKRNKFGELPVLNYFKFNSEIVGLHSIDEALVVCCLDEIYVIYGDDERDFVVKQITDSNTVGVAGYYSTAAVDGSLIFLGSYADDRGNRSSGIFAINGGRVTRISRKIETIFPLRKIGEMSPTVIGTTKPRPYYGSAAIEDRFFVVKANFGTAGTPVLKNLVYDVAENGFCLSDSSTTFAYRSKEFGRPGKWDDMKRAFIRGLGQFTVELYYDGVKEDEITFNITGSAPKTEDFTVPGIRANYFSFRIIGQTNAKVYEFGRLE
jgi:hypothetical protein